MQIQGKLVQSTKVEKFSETFKKVNIIIETDGNTQYPQEICIEVHNANIEKLKGLAKDDEVLVSINLRGKKYEKEGEDPRWFNTLVMWKIEKVGSAAPVAEKKASSAPPVTAVEDEDDDLPF